MEGDCLGASTRAFDWKHSLYKEDVWMLAKPSSMNKKLGVVRILLLAIVAMVIGVVGLISKLGPATVTAMQPNAIEQIVNSVPLPEVPLDAGSSTQEVIGLMLHSHTLWRTLQGQGIVRWLRSNNTHDVTIQKITIEQYGKAYLEIASEGRAPSSAWISDGVSIWRIDLAANTYRHAVVPETLRSLAAASPPTVPDFGSAPVVIGHPMAGEIPSMLSEDIFPLGLAQVFGERRVSVEGSDVVAGRDTVVVRVENVSDDGRLIDLFRYWVDAYTGVILKSQMLRPDRAGEGQAVVDEAYFTEIVYDQPISADLFIFRPGPDQIEVEPQN